MIWMVRHGESVANAGAITSDYAAIPLTDRGTSQARSVAKAFPSPPDWVGCSPFRRARQTAAPLLERYPGSELVELPVHEFTYLAPERCVGLSPATRKPLVDAYWSRMDPDYCDGEGAEPFSGLLRRARQFLEDAETMPGFGVVFSHEQFIRALLLTIAYPSSAAPTALMRRFFALRVGLPIPNGSVVRIRYEASRWWAGGIDARHLQTDAEVAGRTRPGEARGEA